MRLRDWVEPRAGFSVGQREVLDLVRHQFFSTGVTSTRWRTLKSMPRTEAVFDTSMVC